MLYACFSFKPKPICLLGSRVRTSSSLSETDGNFGGRGGQYLAQSLPSRVLPIRHVPVDVTRKPNLSHQLSPPTIRTKSHSDDAMFDLDGFHDSKSYEPFFESDDESSGKLLHCTARKDDGKFTRSKGTVIAIELLSQCYT